MLLIKKSWPFILLAILSFAIHFAFLDYPSEVVFDEVHFGKFVAAYFTGQYYFDIHPPLGKLMIAGFVKLAGVDPVFNFEQIGEALPTNTLFTLRFLPAFFGSLFALFFSWLAWLISRSKYTALLAGFLILLDNAFLVQSKFILIDIFMLCFEVLALCFFFLSQRQKSFTAKWLEYLALTGIFAGLTFSVKWTGLAVIGIIGAISLIKLFSKKLRAYLENEPPERQPQYSLKKRSLEFISYSALVFIVASLVYLFSFWLHFQLLTKSGPGDAFMSPAWQQELKYGRDNVYQPLNLWQKFLELNKTMYTANAELLAEHPFSSKWYSWPLNNKPVYYWNQKAPSNLPGWQAKIYFSGNPILWSLTGLGVIATLLAVFLKKIRQKMSPAFFILLLGYFANLLPFLFIARVAFLYHYLPSAMYATLLLSLWLINWQKSSRATLTIVVGLVAFGFIILSPLSYGWPLPLRLEPVFEHLINFFN